MDAHRMGCPASEGDKGRLAQCLGADLQAMPNAIIANPTTRRLPRSTTARTSTSTCSNSWSKKNERLNTIATTRRKRSTTSSWSLTKTVNCDWTQSTCCQPVFSRSLPIWSVGSSSLCFDSCMRSR